MTSQEREMDRLLFRPEETPPVDPEQFAFALQVAGAAYDYLVPMKSPARKILLEWPDGRRDLIGLRDTPEARFCKAISDHFAPDRKTGFAAMIRSGALQRIWDHERMKKWVQPVDGKPGEVRVDDAVLYAAATLPLDKNGQLEEGVFFEKVEELARQMATEEAVANEPTEPHKP